ncbi:hypothetical protein O6H91_07G119900 [Diphasiastrum complanatum]|uniref:Uncharacterized protein n=1 Tax=Diphasiastrum complanatum TaxID=34168 RepID=A0ACC2D9I3_DIPCM|nr:hypothetical protein O6H91_07G119900 [Diphasiastrum complanatum]
MADEDNITSASHSQQQQQRQRVMPPLPHSSPLPPPSCLVSASSCESRPVKCLDVVLQDEYHGAGSGCGSPDVVASALVCEPALLEEASPPPALPRKRKFEDVLGGSSPRTRIVSDGQKTLRIQDLVVGSGSVVSIDVSASVDSAKDTVPKKGICNESQLEAEEAHSGGFSNTSRDACSVPPSEALEAILDNLQKKDTYGVFAEPVDATEVPGYYDIIREPMDFGTIRDKLSKGTYVSLDLFKKDVLLICSNAMRFNGPKTIYFKQARSIRDAARKSMNTFARQMSGLDDHSVITNKRKATGIKQPWRSLSTCKDNYQPTNLDDRPRAAPAARKGSMPKNDATKLKSTVSDRAGKSWEEDTGTEDDMYIAHIQSGGDKERPFFEYGATGTFFKGKEGRRFPSVFEHCQSSYQPFTCRRPTVSEDFQQLFPMGCQYEHVYSRSLAYFGANFKSAAWKYVSRKIQKVLAPQIPFGPGWVVQEDATTGGTLLEDVEPLKIESTEMGGSLAGVSDGSGIGNKIIASSLMYAADVSCDSESDILPTSRKSVPLVSSVVKEASQAPSLVTWTDTQSQSTGSNIKSQARSSLQTVEQSASGASLDTSALFPTRRIENHQAATFCAIGDGQQMKRISSAERSFEESNNKEVDCMNRSSRSLENASGRSAAVLKDWSTMQKGESVAQVSLWKPFPIGEKPLPRGSFGVKQWNASGQRANAVLDFPAFAVIPSSGEIAGDEVQKVLSWGQVQVKRRDQDVNSAAHEQRLSDARELPQKFPWNMESYTLSRSSTYISPEGAHFQSEPPPLSDYFSVSEPMNLGTSLSSSNLLVAHPQLQSVSPSLCYPWQSLASQRPLGQVATPSFLLSDNSNPCIQFPVTPQALTGMKSSQQPNLALQL